MDILMRFSINLFSILLLLIMLGITKIKKDVVSFSSSIFFLIIIINIIGLFLEPITWYIDGRPGNFMYFLSYAVNTIFIMCPSILVGFWASYLDYKLFTDKKRVQNRLFYQYSTFAIIILLFINYFYPVFFEIDSLTNTYTYGDFAILRYALVYPIYFYFIYLVIRKRKQTSSNIIDGIIVFLLLPTAGSLIQLFLPQMVFTWPTLALSVLVIYIFLETVSGNLDYLTKLYSRRLLQDYMKSLMENKTDFYVIMMDLDRFKEVNDTYGHQVGDQVLVAFANVLMQTFNSKNTFTARLGGDEFMVVLKKNNSDVPELYLQLLAQGVKNNEYLSKFPFLHFSYGYSQYDSSLTIDEILSIADRKMYSNKAKNLEEFLKKEPGDQY